MVLLRHYRTTRLVSRSSIVVLRTCSHNRGATNRWQGRRQTRGSGSEGAGSVRFSVCEAFAVSPTIGLATVSGGWLTRQAANVLLIHVPWFDQSACSFVPTWHASGSRAQARSNSPLAAGPEPRAAPAWGEHGEDPQFDRAEHDARLGNAGDCLLPSYQPVASGLPGEALRIEDRELVHCLLPMMRRASPSSRDVAQRQPDQLARRIVSRKMTARLDDFP
jgi:hypothetical protein